MSLKFLDNVILSSKELEYIEKEQKLLQEKIDEYNQISQTSISIVNKVYHEMISNNSPERENNKWKLKGGVWVLSAETKLYVFREEKISFYKDLFDKMEINYKIDKVGNNAVNEEIYKCSYELTIDKYNDIKKYFEEKLNISDEMVVSILIQKGVINKENKVYVDDGNDLQPSQLIKKPKKDNKK